MNKIIVWLLASFVSLVIASEEKLMVERSVHGFEVSATESAFIAAILSENTASGTWQRLCVGIIIDDLNILAPARCAAVCRFPNVCVASVGVYGELHAGVEIKIVGGLHHDSWIEPTNIFNPFLILDDEIVADDSADNDSLVDIGLLYTERISFTELVQPMPLSEIEIESEENVIFYGWAVRAHRTLRSKNSTAIKCEVKEGKVAIKACITEKTISTYICGDYGAPLVLSVDNTLAGISTLSTRLCNYEIGSTFTQLYPYIDWIEVNMKKDQDSPNFICSRAGSSIRNTKIALFIILSQLCVLGCHSVSRKQ